MEQLLRRWYRLLRRRCLVCGGHRLPITRGTRWTWVVATAVRQRLCRDCAKRAVHAQNYRGGPFMHAPQIGRFSAKEPNLR